jgi:hypothetical protein
MMTFWFVGYKVVCIINYHNIYSYYMTYPILPISFGSIIGRHQKAKEITL